MTFKVVIAAALFLPVSAVASEPLNSAGKSPFIKTPTSLDLADVYPAAALVNRVNGDVQIACKVSEVGILSECYIQKEQPLGFSFGAAAVKLAPTFKVDITSAICANTQCHSISFGIKFVSPRCNASPSKLKDHDWVQIDLLSNQMKMSLDGRDTFTHRVVNDLAQKLDVCDPMKTPIYIMAYPNVDYKHFMILIDVLKSAGYTDLRLVTGK